MIEEDAIEKSASDMGIDGDAPRMPSKIGPNIAMALRTQLAKTPQGKGPLAEIEHWRNRAAALFDALRAAQHAERLAG